MAKKITLLLVIFLIWGCGYQPIYLKKNNSEQKNKVIRSVKETIQKNDIKIMLPENGVNDALEKLNELRLQGNLLKYKIKSIDLRFSDKAIIK